MARPPSAPAPFRRPRKAWTRAHDYGAAPAKRGFGWPAVMIALPLATFTAVFLYDGPPAASAIALTHGADRETAHFARCMGPARETCVVDGDTFWLHGEKIRIADINTPETGSPGCDYEARLGAKATDRLIALLNQGAFTIEPNDDGTGRDRDRYGRLLRTVTRGGASVGEVLVREGLAEEWRGYRRDWC
jgi:endonuclease YncB( thermonuclease family)